MAWADGAGLAHSSSGFGLAVLIYVPLFILRAMGGGDVKLMAAAGAIARTKGLVYPFHLGIMAGGVIALGMLLARNAWARHFTK